MSFCLGFEARFRKLCHYCALIASENMVTQRKRMMKFEHFVRGSQLQERMLTILGTDYFSVYSAEKPFNL